MILRAATVVLAAAAMAHAGTAAARAQAGVPDPGFGAAGLAQVPFGGGARAAAVALGPGGSIAVAGDARGSGGEGALVARFTAAGALDATFSGTGSRLDRFGAGAAAPQRAGAITVAPDGATIVAGVAADQIMVARYMPSGELDGLFGAGGVVLRDLSGGARMPEGTGIAALALAPSGQILVAGSVGVRADDPYGEGEPGEQVVVGRLSDRGVPDPAFGSGGFTLVQLGARSARRPARSKANAIALLPDGAVLIAGRASASDGSERGVVARLTAAGRRDTSFARGGRVLVQLGRASLARPARSALEALALRPDGTLFAAGRGTDVAGVAQVVLARFSAGGALDQTFGRGGVARAQLATARGARFGSAARALALTPDGNAYVAGSVDGGGAFTSRVTPSGALDCTYGLRGQAGGFGGSSANSGLDGAFGAIAQPDGKLVVAGRLAGGGLLLGRLLGGPGVAQAPARRATLRTLGGRYTGRGAAVVYGLVDARCGGAASVRLVARPATERGRAPGGPIQRVSGVYGPQVVCARLRGLKPGRTYRVRLETGARSGPAGATITFRTVSTGRRPRLQEGCAG